MLIGIRSKTSFGLHQSPVVLTNCSARAIVDPDQALLLLPLRITIVHARLGFVANDANFASLFDDLKIIMIKILIVCDCKVAASHCVPILQEFVFEFLLGIEAADCVRSCNQEVPSVEINRNRLDQGRADLEDARVSSIVTEKVVGAWLRVDLQELVVEQKHVEQSVLGVHGCEFDALPLSLAPLKAGVHRLLSPSDVLRLLFCTIWLIADDVSL